MEPEIYNDDMIEEMLQQSAVQAPEEIADNVIAALPLIAQGKRRKRSFWARKKWIFTAIAAVIIIVLLTVLLAMTALKLMSWKAREILQAPEQETEETTRP